MQQLFKVKTFDTISDHVKIQTACFIGKRSTMEDTHIEFSSLSSQHPTIHGCAVFDGHGSDKTSLWLRSAFQKWIGSLEDPFDPIQLQERLYAMDEVLQNHHRYGSTLCMTLYNPSTKQLLVANIGDSKCVVYDSSTYDILFETHDHQPDCDGPETQRIIKAGGHVSCGRVQGDLLLSRAMGDWYYKKKDRNPQDQVISAQADITIVDEFDPQTHNVLVCSDGMTEDFYHGSSLLDIIKSCNDDIAEMVRVRAHTSSDNMTLTVMKFQMSEDDNKGDDVHEDGYSTPTNQPIQKSMV